METFESPLDRLKTVTFGLVGDKSGPNILLGLFLGAAIQTAAPSELWWAVGAGSAWAASVVAYSVVDELQEAIEEQKYRLLDPVEARPRGIE